MIIGEPSKTALAAAMHRAAHQVLERGVLFEDPLALRILGVDEVTVRGEAEGEGRRRMRMFIAMRTRFAEDALLDAVEDGTRQLVVLGAGLDTFAYRSPYGLRVSVFEVDHPTTQAWKKKRLAEAGIDVPQWLTYTSVDFERETLRDGLAAAGFDFAAPAFFTWMGVVPYLTEEAIFATLGFIAGLSGGAEVVFDYSDPPEALDEEMKRFHDVRAERAAALGERWISYFEPPQLREKMLELGFLDVEDLRTGQLVERYIPGRGSQSPQRGGHVLRGWTK